MNKPKDMTGEKHGRFTVIKYVGSGRSGQSLWACKCNECGKEKVIARADILRGRSRCECQISQSARYSAYSMIRLQEEIEKDNERLWGEKRPCRKNDYCAYCHKNDNQPCISAKYRVQRLRKNYLLARDIAEPYIVGQY
jgi:hypothetical protein